MNQMTTAHGDKLMSDVQVVVADADELMRVTANQTGEQIAGATARVQARLNQTKEDVVRIQESATAKVKAVGQTTDGYVHDHPWQSIGIAAGVGLVAGLMLGRR